MTTNFDRAAAFYDETRGLPRDTLNALIDRIAEGLGPADAVLEIGVGTGRVAVPLCDRGYRMAGIDISERMLEVLREKSSAIDARIADATALPFDDASFGGIVAVDVFHLVTEWRRAVDEAVRVLTPGGRIVLSTFETVEDPTTDLRKRIFREAGTEPRRVGIEIIDVMTHLESHFGATIDELEPTPNVMKTSLANELDGLRAATWSRYWELPDDLRHRIADKIERELRDAGTDLDEPLGIEMKLSVLAAREIG